jgi:hypothetical protein
MWPEIEDTLVSRNFRRSVLLQGGVRWYYCRVEYASEILDKPVEWSASEAAKPAFVSADPNRGSVSIGLEPTQRFPHARCLWCDRTFTPRMTGGSTQKFCCTGHRQLFWIAARRWTMRAIEAGLLSVDCLQCPEVGLGVNL